jgi:hypothetical protein
MPVFCRSLLALSIILALLLFKPAPMYILDEIDAALDLSHTQNIGRMLKTHFSQSQFIVVSLKEGMFNNANVIFRTKFVDGVSAVIRTVPGKSGAAKSKDSSAHPAGVLSDVVNTKRAAAPAATKAAAAPIDAADDDDSDESDYDGSAAAAGGPSHRVTGRPAKRAMA